MRSLDFVLWGIPDDDAARTIFVSADIDAVIAYPFADTPDGLRMAEFRAWIDGFIEGNDLSVAEDPNRKPRDTMLARVNPAEAEFWSIRVTDPEDTPGVRSFGAFSALDEFVALSWINREDIDNFDEEVNEVIATWDDYFGTETPHRGDTLDEYLSLHHAV
ncbi:MAG TPA: hypothetical protein VGG01_12300 [Xanthobacteraceae bacterium]